MTRAGVQQDTFNKPADRKRYTAIHIANGLLLLLLWVLTIQLYDRLPEMVPGHLGVRGVTRWEPRGSGSWFLVPIMGTWTAALMYLLSLVVRAGAAGINIPHRKRILALPREVQTLILEPVRPFMFLTATWVLLLMIWLQWTIYRAAQAGMGWRFDTTALAVTILLTILPIAGVFVLTRQVRQRLAEWERGGEVLL